MPCLIWRLNSFHNIIIINIYPRLDETAKVKFEKQGRKLMLNMKKISLNDASEYSCNAGEGKLLSKTIGGLEVQGRYRVTCMEKLVTLKSSS